VRVSELHPYLFFHWQHFKVSSTGLAWWEPYDARVSRTALGGAEGETPSVYSPIGQYNCLCVIRLAGYLVIQHPRKRSYERVGRPSARTVFVLWLFVPAWTWVSRVLRDRVVCEWPVGRDKDYGWEPADILSVKMAAHFVLNSTSLECSSAVSWHTILHLFADYWRQAPYL